MPLKLSQEPVSEADKLRRTIDSMSVQQDSLRRLLLASYRPHRHPTEDLVPWDTFSISRALLEFRHPEEGEITKILISMGIRPDYCLEIGEARILQSIGIEEVKNDVD